jgi:hypothetical protein
LLVRSFQEREEVMGKKSKSKKSKSEKKKSQSPETESQIPNEPASPSFSVDDAYNLLKAVNEVTLKRIEDKHDILERNVTQFMSDARDKLGTLIATVNALDTTVVRDLLPRMERATQAIKAKTDRLP